MNLFLCNFFNIYKYIFVGGSVPSNQRSGGPAPTLGRCYGLPFAIAVQAKLIVSGSLTMTTWTGPVNACCSILTSISAGFQCQPSAQASRPTASGPPLDWPRFWTDGDLFEGPGTYLGRSRCPEQKLRLTSWTTAQRKSISMLSLVTVDIGAFGSLANAPCFLLSRLSKPPEHLDIDTKE